MPFDGNFHVGCQLEHMFSHANITASKGKYSLNNARSYSIRNARRENEQTLEFKWVKRSITLLCVCTSVRFSVKMKLIAKKTKCYFFFEEFFRSLSFSRSRSIGPAQNHKLGAKWAKRTKNKQKWKRTRVDDEWRTHNEVKRFILSVIINATATAATTTHSWTLIAV